MCKDLDEDSYPARGIDEEEYWFKLRYEEAAYAKELKAATNRHHSNINEEPEEDFFSGLVHDVSGYWQDQRYEDAAYTKELKDATNHHPSNFQKKEKEED